MNPLRRLYKRSRRLRRFVRRRKDAVTYYAARFAFWLPRQVSLERALWLADRFGDLAYNISGETRRLSLAHLDLAYGDELTAEAKRNIARAALRNAARCFVELAHLDTIRARFDDYASVEGWEHVEALLALGKGAIVVSGHIGNWELLATYFTGKGLPIVAVARRLSDPRLNQFVFDLRARNGVHTILRESPTSSREILKVLREHGALGLIVDQDIKTPSVTVPFFGHPARTPVAPAALAVRRNMPIVAAFAQRRPGGGHLFTVLPPMPVPQTGDRRLDVLELTRHINQIFEQRIRLHPEEWVWWHKRWRRRPIPKLDPDAEIHYPTPDLP